MSEICTPACNSEQTRTYPIPCKRVTATRKGGFEVFIALDCDSVINDLSDPDEWIALKEASKYIVSPPGFGESDKPDQKTEQFSACGTDEVSDEISKLTWYTKLFDNDNYLDFDFENDFKENYPNKTLLWLGCDGLLYYDYKWVPGTNPGFNNFAAQVYRVSKVGTKAELHIDINFNTFQKGLKGIPLDATLKAAIFG